MSILSIIKDKGSVEGARPLDEIDARRQRVPRQGKRQSHSINMKSFLIYTFIACCFASVVKREKLLSSISKEITGKNNTSSFTVANIKNIFSQIGFKNCSKESIKTHCQLVSYVLQYLFNFDLFSDLLREVLVARSFQIQSCESSHVVGLLFIMCSFPISSIPNFFSHKYYFISFSVLVLKTC